jgi:hypothetical protein
MSKPAQFRVEYQDTAKIERYRRENEDDPQLEEADPGQLMSSKDAQNRGIAAMLAQRLANSSGGTVCIYERRSIVDVTPPGDPCGLIWDWEEEYVTDVQPMDV